MFLNGNLVNVHANTSAFGDELAAGRLVIGGRLGGNDRDQAHGLLDGLRVYNRVLTVEELREAAVFSVTPIPEPSVTLLGLLTAPLMFRRKRSA